MSLPINNHIIRSEPVTPPPYSLKKKMPKSPISKEYPIKIMENGALKVDLTPTAKEKRHVVYQIKNTTNGKRNIGSTTQTVRRRLFSYENEWNHPVPKGRKSRYFRNAILKEKRIAEEKGESSIPMTLKILKVYDPEKLDELDLRNKENDWQLAYDTRNRKRGYNLTDPRCEGKRTGKRKKIKVRKKREPQTNRPPEYLIRKFNHAPRTTASHYPLRRSNNL
ncbi:MAG: hypothetical protein KDK55_02660 [Chlamydiia bacterium]|nr:hypothetical protein [Chlamydiia bacterium]